MNTCSCTGYLTNPYGRCCRDQSYPEYQPLPGTTYPQPTQPWELNPEEVQKLRELLKEQKQE